MNMKSMLRTAMGITLVFISSFYQGPEIGKIWNAAWAVVFLTGLVLLLPVLKIITDRSFKTNNGVVVDSKMFTAKLFYLGAVVGGIMALGYKKELISKGHIYVGKGYDYSISGIDAEKQVMACWIAGAVSLAIAMILHVRAKKDSK